MSLRILEPKLNNMTGFDPAIMIGSTSFQPPPAYNPNMTQPQEPLRDYTVKHQNG